MRIGLVANPLAGIGGPVALKGSDGAETVALARALGGESRVAERVKVCLGNLKRETGSFEILTVAGEMGAAICEALDLECEVVAHPQGTTTTPEDTRRAVRALQQQGVDIILFAGGDGTARDVCEAVSPHQVVLGIPCGVKMHSGVFANSPTAAAKILGEMLAGNLVSVMRGEVRDIDEQAFREAVVRAKYFGEMWVPEELRYLQGVKSGGKEVEALALQEIAADVIEDMMPDVMYFIGSGSTTASINEALGIPGTLLGVDVVKDGKLVLTDARASQLAEFAGQNSCHIVVTPIGGQGHIFGRGNQQFTPEVIRAVGSKNITVISTKSKLEAMSARPLIVDTGDAALDEELAGMWRVVTGYEDAVLYRVVSN
ncbi:MAG TPA: ATP-NAD kinase family protein [Pseudomonadales bacterium]|nr:ATP-NAD kinase family protein [Pseudomonadales bacterium]